MDRRPLNIAMLSVHSCPLGRVGTGDTGGMSIYIRRVASELGRLGHKVDVFTRIHDAQEDRAIRLGTNTRLIHLRAGRRGYLDKLVLHPLLPEFTARLEAFRKTNELQYDIIFSHYWLSGLAGELAQELWHIPHLIMFHTLAAVKNMLGENEPELRLSSERHLAQSCDRVIVPTEREKGNLISYYGACPDNISVIPCGVNLKLFQPLGKETARIHLGLDGDKVILFVGRIERLKGIERLLRAVNLLKNSMPLKLLIIGGDEQNEPEMARLKQLALELGLRETVLFLGVVSRENLPLYYSAADVTAVPSYYESFGLVALESLACGTPIVATDVGDLRHIVQHQVTGYIAEKGTPDDLADKIVLTLTQTPSVPPRFIRQTVERFDWANIALEIERECLKTLDACPAQAL
ncbi:MAG: glycosyltransferase [Chloroflexota bacterium]